MSTDFDDTSSADVSKEKELEGLLHELLIMMKTANKNQKQSRLDHMFENELMMKQMFVSANQLSPTRDVVPVGEEHRQRWIEVRTRARELYELIETGHKPTGDLRRPPNDRIVELNHQD